jgi:predicted enzyme related to lactoylglutathione lyase
MQDSAHTASSTPSDARLGAVQLRAGDAGRAARFFAALLSADPQRAPARGFDPGSLQSDAQTVGSSPFVKHPMDAVFTDDQTAPPARLCFSTKDPKIHVARATALGGYGADSADLRDNQGVPIGFYSRSAENAQPAPAHTFTGALDVVLVFVRDTAKARGFYRQLLGQEFTKVGTGDYWWSDGGPAVGVFAATNDVQIEPFFCVSDLERSMTAVRELSGTTLERYTMGPYHACDCRDDQGTLFGLWWSPHNDL